MHRYIYPVMLAILLLVGAPPVSAAPGDADGLNLDNRPGPDVWIEEHWDVIPEKFAAFMAAYDREVYAFARQTPGYRGYTVATTLPPMPDEPRVVCDGGSNPGCNHLGALVHNGRLSSQGTKGKVLTGMNERMINWDALFQNAFNVLIIHHVKSWKHADKFRARIAALSAVAHPGESFDQRFDSVLAPLATVYWEAPYRMMSTSVPSLDSYVPVPKSSVKDADGINLEPRRGPLVMVGEQWDVPAENLCAFIAAYQREVHDVAGRRVRGYRGYSISTSLPPQPCEKGTKPITAAGAGALGGSDELYVDRPNPSPGSVLRDDIRINAGALYKRTFTVMVRHQVQDWNVVKGWARGAPGGGYEEVYEREHGGADINQLWRRGLFALSRNHTDFFYRLVKTSFVPDK